VNKVARVLCLETENHEGKFQNTIEDTRTDIIILPSNTYSSAEFGKCTTLGCSPTIG
jgi:hypothetical protein